MGAERGELVIEDLALPLALRFISGKYQGGEFPLPDSGEIVIGRSRDADVVLIGDDRVSRQHARLRFTDGKLLLDCFYDPRRLDEGEPPLVIDAPAGRPFGAALARFSRPPTSSVSVASEFTNITQNNIRVKKITPRSRSVAFFREVFSIDYAKPESRFTQSGAGDR